MFREHETTIRQLNTVIAELRRNEKIKDKSTESTFEDVEMINIDSFVNEISRNNDLIQSSKNKQPQTPTQATVNPTAQTPVQSPVKTQEPHVQIQLGNPQNNVCLISHLLFRFHFFCFLTE